ncbi:hypothetical protein OROGR_025036 [Orobanche gracilis]
MRNNSINNQLWISACGKGGILTRVIKLTHLLATHEKFGEDLARDRC